MQNKKNTMKLSRIKKKPTLLLSILLSFTVCLPVNAVTWQLAESWSKDTPVFGDAVKRLIENVELFSNGEFKIESVAREVHKKPFGVFEMVRDNTFEMGHSASYFWKDRDINTLFFTTLPMEMVAIEQYGWFYHDEGMELMQKVFQKHGMLAFPGGNTGNQMGGWFKKKIETVDDLKGLKIHIPGLAGDVMKSLGAKVINLPDDQLYNAFRDGKLDAVEWIGPSMDLGMNFHELAVYYYTGWHEPSTELQFLVNEEAFKQLSKHHQGILIKSMRLAAYDTYIQAYHDSAKNLRIMKAVIPNLSLRAFPRQVYRALVKESARQLDKISQQGDQLSQDIIKSRKKYLEFSRVWTRFSDQAFLNNQF